MDHSNFAETNWTEDSTNQEWMKTEDDLTFPSLIGCKKAQTNRTDPGQTAVSRGLSCLPFWHSSPDNQHFKWEQKKKDVCNFRMYIFKEH